MNEGPPKQRRRVINPDEAPTVVRIFELCAAGLGFKKIMQTLTEENAPAPLRKRPRIVGWHVSSVREVLYRRLYLGEFSWNRTKKRNERGQAKGPGSYQQRDEKSLGHPSSA